MLKTLKLATSELHVGMFVSGLDRPWLGTPFYTQGFVIESQEDIIHLQKYCESVYIDSRRSHKQIMPVRREVQRHRDQVATKAAKDRRLGRGASRGAACVDRANHRY
jgi:hypothetical protein